MTIAQALALTVAVIACVTDLRIRRVPNVLTFGAAIAAVLYAFATAGLSGLGWAVAGWVVGLLLFLPLFALRGMGGGDVKLLAALGAWMGPGATLWVAFWAAVVGGVLALVAAFSAGYLRTAFTNVWSLLMFWRVAGLQPHPAMNLDTSGAPRLPYALPVALGLVVTLWTR